VLLLLSSLGYWRSCHFISILFTFIDPCSQGHSDVATEPLHPTTQNVRGYLSRTAIRNIVETIKHGLLLKICDNIMHIKDRSRMNLLGPQGIRKTVPCPVCMRYYDQRLHPTKTSHFLVTLCLGSEIRWQA
jgi:hypothetical protein